MASCLIFGDISHQVYLQLANALQHHLVRWASPHEYPFIHKLDPKADFFDGSGYDYFVFLLTKESCDTRYIRFARRDFKKVVTIVHCLDEESYEKVLQLDPDSYHFWVLELSQLIDLINEGGKPFVTESQIDV